MASGHATKVAPAAPSRARPLFDDAAFGAEAAAYLHAHPETEKVELLFPDANGVIRGKWVPADDLPKLSNASVRLPISAYALDIWGEDVDAAGLALALGDPDGLAHPAPGTLVPVPWAVRPTAQVMMSLSPADAPDEPCPYDPRSRLYAVLERLAYLGLTPVVAMELEFFVYRADSPPQGPPLPPHGAPEVGEASQIYDLDVMASFQPLLDDIREACLDQNVPVGTTIAEFGPGQFEINLLHVPDAMMAADHAVMFRRIVRHVCRSHDLEATFMAKPLDGQAGSGLHMHASLLDRAGVNLFAAPEEEFSPVLGHAIAGLLDTMGDCMAVFAPHANSYRRFQPNAYVPMSPCWGFDHRGVAVRVPSTSGPAARLEHRVCGADANPYLALAAMLGGILKGLEASREPPEPLDGQVEPTDGDRLPTDWASALARFETSAVAQEIFGEDFHRVYTACRKSELGVFNATITDLEYRTYLRRL
ncbi:MAG: glutamine synthetase [Rhodospirillaceae bacterium]|nr:glutamine synthetase [Rhodospirillaceae bacterium]